jgi:hypothetical protein
MDFSVLADRDCLVAFAAVVLCSDRGVQAHTTVYDHGGIAHLTAKGASGQTGLSKAAAGRALRRLEEAGLVIAGGGDHDDWRHDIVAEKITPALPGVVYPRCTGGRGWAPEEDSGGIWAHNEAVAAAGPVTPFTPDALSTVKRSR